MSHYQPLLSDSLFGSGVGDKSNLLKVTWLALRQVIGPTRHTITAAQQMQDIMCWSEHVCMQTLAILEIVNVLVNK